MTERFIYKEQKLAESSLAIVRINPDISYVYEGVIDTISEPVCVEHIPLTFFTRLSDPTLLLRVNNTFCDWDFDLQNKGMSLLLCRAAATQGNAMRHRKHPTIVYPKDSIQIDGRVLNLLKCWPTLKQGELVERVQMIYKSK